MTGPAADGGRGWAVWTAGLVVVIAAGAATAHGLFVVALGSGTPGGIAWLYPVITDGLALVAYAATTRLTGGGRRYAWSVVVLAAGLSGLAQATYLAGALPPATSPAAVAGALLTTVGPAAVGAEVAAAPPVLRFGVGAWPAIAAAIAAHLLFLIGTHRANRTPLDEPSRAARQHGAPGPALVRTPLPAAARTAGPAVPVVASHGVPSSAVPSDVPCSDPGVPARPGQPVVRASVPADTGPDAGQRPGALGVGRDGVSQRERAQRVARALAARSGALPSVRELAEAAEVGRGTADRALAALRASANGQHRPDAAVGPARTASTGPTRHRAPSGSPNSRDQTPERRHQQAQEQAHHQHPRQPRTPLTRSSDASDNP